MAKGIKTGGRVKGTPNKNTRDIKALASVHGPAAIETLLELMTLGESEQARAAAARELLDRGYGKAAQPIEASGDITGGLADALKALAALRKV